MAHQIFGVLGRSRTPAEPLGRGCQECFSERLFRHSRKDLQSRCRPAVYPVRPYFRLRRRRRSEAGRPLVSKARNSCSNSGPSRICSTALILAKSLRPITWPLDFVSVALTIFLAMGSLYQYPLSPEPPHDLAARATPAVAATSFSVRGVRPSGWPGR